ncbi:MAG TPA: glycosyltransferase family 4 protein [Candidatus Moranbacteria bacterium]|nr:glycosyltransferase family 4 protein [Candidatus Moranbacteria bacterium]
MENPNILFVSRAYPPVVGGIENQNYELSVWLARYAKVKTIANKKGRKFLPFFAPYALFYVLFSLYKYDVVLLGDGLLSFLAWAIKIFSKKPVICVVHGLDINYNSASLGVCYEKILIWLYQKIWINIFIKKVDSFIAVGNETIRVGIKLGIPEEKFIFIPNGVDAEKNLLNASQKDLENIIKKSVEGKKVLLTSGRLAKQKGVAWFIRNVMPKLGEEFVYVVAGDGPDRKNIENAIEKSGCADKIVMLGRVSDRDRNILFNTADLFLQPNVKVPGDMEGFGISVIEAGACRLPVLAANIEGLRDAIKDGRNGFLVESGNASAFVEKINQLFNKGNPRKIFGEETRKFVVENYSWKNIAQKYLEEIRRRTIGPSVPTPISPEEIVRRT